MIYSLIVLAASELLLIFAIFFFLEEEAQTSGQALCVGWRREERQGISHLKELGVRRRILLLLRV